jgi:ATP-dependent Clp protease ATP-binding subunit ClpC
MRHLFWHYTKGPKRFFEIWISFISFFWRFFGVSLHLRTLFSPWKRDISKVGRRGLHPVMWMQSLLENIVTRFLGSFVRSGLIIAGIFSEIFIIILGAILFLMWLLLPFFLLSIFFSAPYYFVGNLFIASIWLILFLLALWLLFLSRRLYDESKRNYLGMGFQELAQESWFIRVWERIGKIPSATTFDSLKDPLLLERFLESCEITIKEFQQIVDWETKNQIELENNKKFWYQGRLDSILPLGKEWTFAYTVNLDKYSRDLSRGDFSEYKDSKLVGHDQDLAMLELILTRPTQNNALIMADEGVGKHTLIHALAEKIRNRKTSPALLNKRILEMNLNEVISAAANPSELDSVLRAIFFEAAYAGNIILVVSDIDQYLRSSPQSSKENISAVLLEFLNYPTFQIIGLTTPEKYHEDLEKNAGIMKFFEKIQIGESSPEDALTILLYKLIKTEKNGIIFTYSALKEIIKQTDRYFTNSPFPEKALDLSEEALVYWSQNSSDKYITPQIIDDVVSQKIKVPVGDLASTEKDKLIHLEEILHKRVVGQNFAISQIAETMRRARVGMANSKKPIGSFLFLGPTGVGKTESAKALAEAYFGNENRMIRLDMSEYQRADSLERLIGSIENKKTGILEDKVEENPYALLLLDEIEKANHDILNLFLQILDEGWMTDVFGKKISFRNQIIIATSNAAADIIKESIEKNIPVEEIQKIVTDYVIKNGIFMPEFINRFEGVIFFHPLSREEVFEVTNKLLASYSSRLFKEKNISVEFSPEVSQIVAQKSFDPVFGARAINRYIEDKIGDNIVKKIISEEVKENEKIIFNADELT